MKLSRHKHNMFFSVSNNKNRPACCASLLACCVTRIATCWQLLAGLQAALALLCLPDCLLGCLLAQPAGGLLLAACSLQSLGRSLLGCARAASLQLLACRRAAPACFSGACCSCSAGGWRLRCLGTRLAACLHRRL